MKSDDPGEGELLAAVVAKLPPDRRADLAFSGHEAPMTVLRERVGARTLSKPRLKRCLLGYVALGWAGHVPEACRNSIVYLPVNAAPWLWGWDRVLLERFHEADAEVYAIGPWTGGWSDGLDDPALLTRLPAGYGGGIGTDRIDVIAPLAGR